MPVCRWAIAPFFSSLTWSFVTDEATRRRVDPGPCRRPGSTRDMPAPGCGAQGNRPKDAMPSRSRATTARLISAGLLIAEGGSVLLTVEAGDEAIICAPALHEHCFEEDREFIVDRRRLRGVRVIVR